MNPIKGILIIIIALELILALIFQNMDTKKGLKVSIGFLWSAITLIIIVLGVRWE
tara:strand:- start:1449 stop:1613 length:165 start_codon:yes stop_codon:yes gene_type:complete